MAARPGRVLQDLEVQLPMPAQPGRRPELAEMARHIRGLLRQVEPPRELEAAAAPREAAEAGGAA